MLSRLFQIVYLLMERPQITAQELADIFEVSKRTIYRDLDKLTMAGIPVYTNQGKKGGISLLNDYVLDKAILTQEEKNKIMESLNAYSEVNFSKGDSFTKLRRFLGEYQDWIEISFSSWQNNEKNILRFEQLKKAILNHFYLEIIYSSNHQGCVKRKIKPLKLCFKEQDWYLYAYCCLREDYRFFKLKRISEIHELNESFEPEIVSKVLNETSYDNNPKINVTLEIHQQMAFRAYEELDNITLMENGNLLCHLEVSDINWFISYLLSYGSYIRVIEPDYLKERIIQEIMKMKKIYQ
ncbi:MAG: helix-turn-helix transcriptional regulator [Traorella sp.]